MALLKRVMVVSYMLSIVTVALSVTILTLRADRQSVRMSKITNKNGWVGGTILVARRTNNRKVVGSRPTKVVCITMLTGNRLGWTVRCGRPPLLLLLCWRFTALYNIGSHLPFTSFIL